MRTKIIKHELIVKNFNEKIDEYINQIDENEIDCFILQSSNSRLKTKRVNNDEIQSSFDFVRKLLQKINICNVFMRFRLYRYKNFFFQSTSTNRREKILQSSFLK